MDFSAWSPSYTISCDRRDHRLHWTGGRIVLSHGPTGEADGARGGKSGKAGC